MMVKAIRAVTAWLCWLGISWWMVMDVERITVPVLLIWALFFVFSFGAGAGKDGRKEQ